MSNNINRIRTDRHYTLRFLAQRIGVSHQAVHRAEQGRCSAELAEKIANELKCNVFEILGDDAFIKEPKGKEEICVLIKNLKSKLKN